MPTKIMLSPVETVPAGWLIDVQLSPAAHTIDWHAQS